MSNHYLKISTFCILTMSSSFIMPMVSPFFEIIQSNDEICNNLQKNTYLNHNIVTRVKKTNTNYCTFTIILIWLFRSVVYLWHLTCIPYEVMPIEFFDWLTTYISNSRVHIFIHVWIPLFLSSWTNEKMLIYANITPTYLLVHFQFQSKCNRSPLYCWEKKKHDVIIGHSSLNVF